MAHLSNIVWPPWSWPEWERPGLAGSPPHVHDRSWLHNAVASAHPADNAKNKHFWKFTSHVLMYPTWAAFSVLIHDKN